MTYSDLKNQVSVLLTSDNKLPVGQPELVHASLKFAYIEIADMATPLKWLTKNKDTDIMRKGPGSYFVRMPKMPIDDTDELDIDSELVPSVARLIASYFSKDINLKNYHRKLAADLMKKYESKVREYILSQESAGAYDNVRYDQYGSPILDDNMNPVCGTVY